MIYMHYLNLILLKLKILMRLMKIKICKCLLPSNLQVFKITNSLIHFQMKQILTLN